MTNEAIKQAGLLRCCISHLIEVRDADPLPPAEESFETCRYCGGQIIWENKAWRWPYRTSNKPYPETVS